MVSMFILDFDGFLYCSLRPVKQKTHYVYKIVFLYLLLRHKFEKSLEIWLFSIFRDN